MTTTMTSGQLQATLELQRQKGMTPERYQALLQGLLADVYGIDPAVTDLVALRRAFQLAVEMCRRPASLTQTAPTPMVQPEALLVASGTVKPPPTTGRFQAADWFKLGQGASGLPKIVFLGDNFRSYFLKGAGQSEAPVPALTLQYGELGRWSTGATIVAALGGEAKAETTLTEIFSLLSQQQNGERGALLTNGYTNVFFVRDSQGVLRVVGVGWHDDGWYVNVYPVGSSDGWSEGRRVFSRLSTAATAEVDDSGKNSDTPALNLTL